MTWEKFEKISGPWLVHDSLKQNILTLSSDLKNILAGLNNPAPWKFNGRYLTGIYSQTHLLLFGLTLDTMK